MGSVWAAKNELTNRDCAIKLLLPELAQNLEALARFVKEAKTTGTLRHPNIIDVLDAGATDDGTPYLVMELLAGESLEQRLERRGFLEPADACAVMMHIARGLEAAHAAGVIHRDLSAANVFLARAAGAMTPKILDFGVSKTVGPELASAVRTGNGAVLGSPQYMSPEQARGAENVDARTDIWAVGVLLYLCVVGAAPFRGRNYNQLMLAIMATPHRPILDVAPGIDIEFAQLVEHCLRKESDRSARKRGGAARAPGISPCEALKPRVTGVRSTPSCVGHPAGRCVKPASAPPRIQKTSGGSRRDGDVAGRRSWGVVGARQRFGPSGYVRGDTAERNPARGASSPVAGSHRWRSLAAPNPKTSRLSWT